MLNAKCTMKIGECPQYDVEFECNKFLSKEEIENRLFGQSSIEVKRIIYNNPATIVFWQDGTKTVVKCMDGTPFNPYYGFVCALAKKVYGSNSRINRIVDKYTEE